MKKSFIIITLIVLLSSSVCLSFQSVHAQTELTLAETINNVVSNIQNWDSPWTVLYGQIFSQTTQSAYDVAIQQALSAQDYTDVIFIATLAQLNGYSSTIINSSVTTALENMPMCGSLPVTCVPSFGYAPEAFCLYDRYMINAYQYAQELGVSGWNITQAFLDFANAYLQMPFQIMGGGHTQGDMLVINPALNISESYSSRYYDEYAETLGIFLMFAEAGVTATVSYNGQNLTPIDFANDMWLQVQSLWNGNYYNYVENASVQGTIECEMGSFAQIITEYQNYVGDIPYFSNVIGDLEYTLLAENFSSPIWSTAGVLQHATGNPEQRLEETTAAIIALQMLYPDFNSTMQSNFQGMLENGMWQGLINSSLYSDNQFQFVCTPALAGSGTGFSDDASSVGAMTLFLDGIVPITGYLAINASNQDYDDSRTCFPTSEWNFNYQTQTITIPVMVGTLGFLFGSSEVTQNFPTNGVYVSQFSSNWNNIVSITQIANINSITLQPITIQAIQRPISIIPSTTPNPISTPTPTFLPIPMPTSTPIITSTSTPVDSVSSTPFNYNLLIIASTIALVAIISIILVHKRRLK